MTRKEVKQLIYTIDELSRKITPIAHKYNLSAVYLFGSYAREKATETSDIDVLIDKKNSDIKSLFDLGNLYNDLCETLDKNVDIVTTDALRDARKAQRTPWFTENIMKERVEIYER